MIFINKKIEMLKKHRLFCQLDDECFLKLINKADTNIKNIDTGETVFSKDSREKVMGIILLGAANVYSIEGQNRVLIRTLSELDAFGVSTLFEDNFEFSTHIVAKKASTVIFFSKDTIEELIDCSKDFRQRYISFLSERICFLNRKISCYTAGTPERKLSAFLCSQSSLQQFTITINANTISSMLDVGRASLYRAFERMIKNGLIIKEGKSITVPDRNKLEIFYSK